MQNNEYLIGQRHAVLDKGWIELIDFMPHPGTGVPGDLAIVDAARVSFMGDSKGEEADKRLLMRLLKDQHTSPFEQVQFKFRVRAPMLVYWQWIRHRTFQFQSINSQSGRYTPFEEDDFYFPQEWRRQSAKNKQGSDGVIDVVLGKRLSEDLDSFYRDAFTLYKTALDQGVSKELARVFLPGFSVYYTWIVGVNALNLMNFLRLRMAPDAQAEIRAYADCIYEKMFKPLLPWTAEAFELYVFKPES